MKLSSRSARRGGNLELNMTPMIDVVFLLLIFFMTTSSIVQSERELDPAIKVQRKSAGKAARDLQPAVIEITELATGEFVYKIGGRECITVSELTTVLMKFQNKEEAFVRVPDGARFDMAAGAIQACKDASFVTVAYVPASSTP